MKERRYLKRQENVPPNAALPPKRPKKSKIKKETHPPKFLRGLDVPPQWTPLRGIWRHDPNLN